VTSQEGCRVALSRAPRSVDDRRNLALDIDGVRKGNSGCSAVAVSRPSPSPAQQAGPANPRVWVGGGVEHPHGNNHQRFRGCGAGARKRDMRHLGAIKINVRWPGSFGPSVEAVDGGGETPEPGRSRPQSSSKVPGTAPTLRCLALPFARPGRCSHRNGGSGPCGRSTRSPRHLGSRAGDAAKGKPHRRSWC